MELIEDSLDISIDTFLERPQFCYLANVSQDCEPRVSPLWYLWEDGSIWIIAGTEKSYYQRVLENPPTAIAFMDFDVTTGRVHHVGMRGTSSIVPLDQDRVARLLRRYLGDDTDRWDPRFIDIDPDRWHLIRFDPETVVARDQSFEPSL